MFRYSPNPFNKLDYLTLNRIGECQFQKYLRM